MWPVNPLHKLSLAWHSGQTFCQILHPLQSDRNLLKEIFNISICIKYPLAIILQSQDVYKCQELWSIYSCNYYVAHIYKDIIIYDHTKISYKYLTTQLKYIKQRFAKILLRRSLLFAIYSSNHYQTFMISL